MSAYDAHLKNTYVSVACEVFACDSRPSLGMWGVRVPRIHAPMARYHPLLARGCMGLWALTLGGCSLISVKGDCPAMPQPPAPISVHYERCDKFAACFTKDELGQLTKALQAQNDYDARMRQ
jgi:hypothetical protein